jgi:hypothetical protein
MKPVYTKIQVVFDATADAITIQERVAADRTRILGPEHPDTVAVVHALREWKRRPRRHLRLSRRERQAWAARMMGATATASGPQSQCGFHP